MNANIYTDTFPLRLSDQFISSHRVKDGETREGDAVFPPSNSPHSDSQTIFSAAPCHPTHTHTHPDQQNHAAELSHHFFRHLNLLSPRLGQFRRRKMPFSSLGLWALQLHLKALLQEVSPRAFIIERIAAVILRHTNGICRQILDRSWNL